MNKDEKNMAEELLNQIKEMRAKMDVLEFNMMEQRNEFIKSRKENQKDHRRSIYEMIEKIRENKIMTSQELGEIFPSFALNGNVRKRLIESSFDDGIHFLKVKAKGSPYLIVEVFNEASANFVHLWKNRQGSNAMTNNIFIGSLPEEERISLKQWINSCRLNFLFRCDAELIIMKIGKNKKAVSI